MSAIIGVSYHPIRGGKFSKSPEPIPDWSVCGVGRFAPIRSRLESPPPLTAKKAS